MGCTSIISYYRSNDYNDCKMIRSSILLLWLAGFASAQNKDGIYLDRFTYNDQDVAIEHDLNNDGINDHVSYDYAPENWGDIMCNEGSRLDECVGYPDKWETGRAWEISKNYCKSCPEGGDHNCGRHHQSPVNLQRVVGLDVDPDSPNYSEQANECIVSIETVIETGSDLLSRRKLFWIS